MRRVIHAVCALGVLAIAHAQARAQEVVLQWDWREGQVFTYRLTERMEQASEALGVNAGAKSAMSHQRVFTIEDEVTRVAGGISTVKRTFQRVEVRLDHDAERIEFDSDNDDEGAADPRVRPYARLAGVEIEFDADREGKVHDVRGAGDAIDRVFQALTAMPALQGLNPKPASREAVRRQIEQGLRVMPNRTVRPGDTWSVPVEHEMPIVGKIRHETIYRFRGMERAQGRECAAIDSTTEMSIVPNPNGFPGLLNITMERGLGEGRLHFDPDRSVIVRWEQKLDSAWTAKGELSPDIPTGFKQTIKQDAVMELISGG